MLMNDDDDQDENDDEVFDRHDVVDDSYSIVR